MSYSATLRPFGFSQPTHVTIRTEKRSSTPVPSDDSNGPIHIATIHRKARTHRLSIPNYFYDPYMSPTSPRPHMTLQRSGTQRAVLDEEEDVILTNHSGTSEKRHPARSRPFSHARGSSMGSPNSSTTTRRLANLQLRIPSEISPIREAFSEKQLQQQIKEVYSALRRVEDEREKILTHMKAGRADQCRVERELEETRRENQRLTARLEEMLRSSKKKSPSSARSDDGWGCSMYDMEAEGY